MNPTGNDPERVPMPAQPQFNAAPGLGGMAANLAPNTNPNAAPTVPEIAPSMPELAPMGAPEQLSNPETQIGPMQSTPGQPVPATPVPQQPIVVQSTTTTSDNSGINATAPATAADEDLIEKEWVTQAKKIISSTKNDPYEQAHLVAALMRDYVRKRYGKEVGKAPDE